ncbi:MAG TPA: DUF2147 domain-containing protein [Hyphomicrobium sp.]|uniref:DUF2147 domain-containing protein n=1 Tax=Hyphomicrobium sp. TaxID=82 RepID=UPI002CC551BD|nr:DUF2147 domain-containing protein [Hyphomicrobium sp.]HRN88176.1 DUF2147 domain-containing protein [Hyphomicrobium sp.]
MPFERKGLHAAAIAAAVLVTSPALAADGPLGVWVNDTGRGAIEIKQCGDKLCGHVVWVKDTADSEGCGRQIIGDVTNSGGGVWGDGWIYSPERKRNYNVELTPQKDGTLKVKGFAGVSFLSRTMIWTKAPADLTRCGTEQIEAAAPPPAAATPPPPAAVTEPAPGTRSEPGTARRAAPSAAPAAPASPGKQAAPAPEAAPPPADGPDIAAREETDRDGVDLGALAEEFGDVFTRKDGKCKVDTPWVKLDFDCGER